MTPLAAYLLLFAAVGIGFIFAHLVAGKLIRPSRPSAEKGTTYECGEPTIGSAWVQFDLRFYVIALLFVIFDVEVAFFFPWAEVFGKANAIANTPEPRTAAQYNDLGNKILDLAVGGDLTERERQALPNRERLDLARWQAMAGVTEQELEAVRTLAPTIAQKDRLFRLLPEQFDAMHRQTPEQRRQSFPELTAGMSDVQVAALGSVTRQGLFLLDQSFRGDSPQEQARSIAWVALIEVLVFFGVLLVGFAYLWRRGDLAWVRSTTAVVPAERAEVLPTAEPAPPRHAGTEVHSAS